MYNATASYGGAKIIYHMEDTADHRSFQESVTYAAPGFAFVHRSDARAADVLALVYGRSLAQDFLNAAPVAVVPTFQSKVRIAFFRGKRFGYAAAGDTLTLYRLANLATQIKNAKACATMECGD